MPVRARLAYPGHWTIFFDTASRRRFGLHLARLSGYRSGVAIIRLVAATRYLIDFVRLVCTRPMNQTQGEQRGMER